MALPTAAPKKRKGPQEISSKQPVSVLRQVVPVTRPKAVDPRFDRAFGDFHDDQFRASYSFIGGMQERERATLQASLATETNPYRAADIKKSLARQDSMRAAHEKTEKEKSMLKQWRKEEMARVERGEKQAPFFLKKSAQKQLSLVAQYKELKERSSGRPLNIDKLAEKRRKHKASRQHIRMPRKQFKPFAK